jgi:hypothetical protein
LNGHPHIHCDHEIFLKFVSPKLKKASWPRAYLLGHSFRPLSKAYGCNLRFNQVKNVTGDPQGFLNRLRDDDWSFIYLRRNNLLRLAVSVWIARTRKVWHAKSENGLPRDKINLDSEALMGTLLRAEKAVAGEEQVLAQIPHLRLTYEEDLLAQERHQETADRVFEYLELPSAEVEAKSIRLGPDRLSEAIENFDEISRMLRNTRFSKFLADVR